MLLAGLAPAVLAYFSRELLEAITGAAVLDGFFYLFTVSLMVLVSSVFAGIISKRILERAQQMSDRGEAQEIEALLTSARRAAEINAPTRHLEELEKVTGLLRALEEGMPGGVLIMRHQDGRFVSANATFRRMFGLGEGETGYSQLKAGMLEAIDDPDAFEAFWKARGEGLDPQKQWKLTSGGETNWVRIASLPVEHPDKGTVIWLFHDVSEQHHLCKALHRSQRMESIGRLAGGVAHDFNNMLTGIIGNLSLAELSDGDASAPGAELIISARKAGQRAADLVKRLLDYSRDGAAKIEQVDVNELSNDTYELLRNSFDPKIRFDVSLAEEIWPVNADVTQLQQVLLNLCMNARDALEDGGEIRIRTENVSIDSAQAKLPGASEGDCVCLAVQDNGVGIPPEVISRIFDPYFTTKSAGSDSGTGIGLAVTGEIVRKHGGWITCESVVGRGTTFRVFLQRAVVAEKTESEPSESDGLSLSLPAGAARGVRLGSKGHDGTETVLVVDDEEFVRKVSEGMLKKKGYRVLLASDGEEAIRVFDQHKDEIHLVLLDLMMPKLSGMAVFEMIKERALAMPVLLCSGHPVDLDEFEAEAGYRPDGALQKPFTVETLCDRIRDVFDAHYGLILSSAD